MASVKPAADKKERKSYAIIVETAKDGYASTLRKVKESLTNIEAKNAIKGMRSTKEGKLLITLEKDEEKMKEIHEAIKNVPDGLKARKTNAEKK
ncbi:hypothetical protein WA026_005369 [Henosepilachna vigintioctopunctata]